MNKKNFIEGLGATCNNWRNSWSYVNHNEKFVVFGAWDVHEENIRCKIFDLAWQVKANGHKNQGFKQSLAHIQLCENDGYALKTFKLFYEEGNPETGTAKIKSFTPQETDRVLVKEGDAWFAYPAGVSPSLTEKIGSIDVVFLEGARTQSVSTNVDRNRAARQACLEEFGFDCSVCEFNFKKTFGLLGDGFIHVHHLNPVSATEGEYELNPKTDLRPVCPNCHAMLHRKTGKQPYSILELKEIINGAN